MTVIESRYETLSDQERSHRSVAQPNQLSTLASATVAFCLAGLLGVWVAIFLQVGPRAVPTFLKAAVVTSAFDSWLALVFNPFYWGVLVVLAIVQCLWPAQRRERILSQGFVEDATWFFASTVFSVSVVAGLLRILHAGFLFVSGGWSLSLTPWLGVWGVAMLAFVLSDGLAWLSHWTHHHVPRLWYFHAVHHSQTSMNVLSDSRQHIVETLISATIVYIPGVMLGLSSPQAMKLAFGAVCFSAFIHSNIRTNLGPLRFLFISPQAHRVHHSVEEAHFNSNYGTVFSFWDALFRTRHTDQRSYPETGIADDAFPHGNSRNPLALVSMWGRQTLYPFGLVVSKRVNYAGNTVGAAPSAEVNEHAQ